MLGLRKERCLDRSVLVSLEALVPRDHFYRHLEAKLDLGFVRELAHDHYEATQVRANAGLDSLIPRFYLRAKQHLEDLFGTGSAEATSAGHVPPATNKACGQAVEALRPEPQAVPIPLPSRSTADEQTQLA